MRPEKLNILGKEYKVIYCDNAVEVDLFKRKACFGQIDQWTTTIRIYIGTSESEIFDSLVHEVLHGIVENLKISTITGASNYEDVIGLLALGLSDFLARNDWLKDGGK